jgi:hypothetical protein
MRLRAGIVLAALMLVPLAAIFGAWRPWVGRAGSSAATAGGNTAAQPAGQAADLSPSYQGTAQTDATPKEGTVTGQAPAASHVSRKPQAVRQERLPKAKIRAVQAASTEDAPPTQDAPTTQDVPTTQDAPLAVERNEAEPGNRQILAETWRAAQQRLEALGAVTWRLETWGSQGLYRFSCAVSLAGQSRSTRYFEAVAARAETAIEQVVSEVEAFRAGQSATAAGRQPLRR